MKQNAHYPPVNVATRIMAERAIIYRPQLKQQLGSVTGSLLLNQIAHWFHANKDKPFWKFAAPCEHRKYRKGDSWQEELGFVRSEYENALKSIATRIKPTERFTSPLKDTYNADGSLAPVERIVIYWRDRDNVTWYWLNTALYEEHLKLAYQNFTPHASYAPSDETFADVENEHSSDVEIQHSRNVENEHPPYTEMYIKEEQKDSAPAAQATATPNQKRPMYDAIFSVWGFVGARNGEYQRFLTGKETKRNKDCNIEPPVSPDELLAWGKWYRHRNARDGFVMVESPSKVQSSIAEFRRVGNELRIYPAAQPSENKLELVPDEQPEPPTLTDLMRNAGYEVSS